MKIDDFRCIVTIAETRNLKTAAKRLFITLPLLRQRLEYIERQYQTELFTIDSSGPHLTKNGKLFIRHAERILKEEQAIRQTLLPDEETNCKLSLGAPHQILITPYIHSLISAFIRKEPDISLTICDEFASTLQDQLLSQEIEIAVCYLPLISDNLAYIPIRKDRFVLVPAKGSALEKTLKAEGLPGGSTIDFHYLKDEPLASSVEGTKTDMILSILSRKYQIPLRITHHCRKLATLQSLGTNGIASTLILESLLESYYSSDTPFYYLMDDEECSLTIALVWNREHHLSEEAEKFIQTAQGGL